MVKGTRTECKDGIKRHISGDECLSPMSERVFGTYCFLSYVLYWPLVHLMNKCLEGYGWTIGLPDSEDKIFFAICWLMSPVFVLVIAVVNFIGWVALPVLEFIGGVFL